MKSKAPESAAEEYREAMAALKAMTKEERLKWFEENAKDDFAFGCEIDGTIYFAECLFRKPEGETMLGKTCRILIKEEIAPKPEKDPDLSR